MTVAKSNNIPRSFKMIPEFDILISNPKINQDAIFSLLKDSVSQIINNHFDFEESLFEHRGVEIKLILQSCPLIFWKLWDYLDSVRLNNQTHHGLPLQDTLNKDGVTILKSYFSKEEAEALRQELIIQMSMLPLNTDPEVYGEACQYRHYIRQNKDLGTRFIVASPFDTKNISLFSNKLYAPDIVKPYFSPSHALNQIVSDYMGTEAVPSDVSFEKVNAPAIYRNDDWWHIDNLTDQFKIMIIVRDMRENDGPFKFIRGTHRDFSERQKSRYHKMFAMMGVGTQESNHFEDDFVEKRAHAEAPILAAGDVILFDCKTQHSWNYAYESGERNNILLAYFDIPTLKNLVFGKINRFLKYHR